MVTTAIKIQKLESLADLDCLVRGDVIDSIYQNMPLWKYGEKEERIVFHRQFPNGALQFVLPAEHSQGEYVIVYKAGKDQIERRDGKIILNEDRSYTESFRPENPEYREFNQTLVMAGLRSR